MEANGKDTAAYETVLATGRKRILAKLRAREDSERLEFGPESEFAARRADFNAQITERRRQIRDLQHELEGLEEDKDWLRHEKIREKQAAEEAFDERWEKEIMPEIEPYSQTLCKKLCKTVYQALLRELRDHVYSYLAPGDFGMYHDICDTEDFWAGKGLFLPWYHDPAYVGPLMAREVTEAYYKSIIIGYGSDTGTGQLRKFLTTDRFGQEMEPGKCLRRLMFMITLEEDPQDARGVSLVTSGIPAIKDDKLSDLLIDDISSLQILEMRKGRIEFSISINSEEKGVNQFVCFLDTAIPVIRFLKEQDYEIELMVYCNEAREKWQWQETKGIPLLENLTSFDQLVKDSISEGRRIDTSLFNYHLVLPYAESVDEDE